MGGKRVKTIFLYFIFMVIILWVELPLYLALIIHFITIDQFGGVILFTAGFLFLLHQEMTYPNHIIEQLATSKLYLYHFIANLKVLLLDIYAAIKPGSNRAINWRDQKMYNNTGRLLTVKPGTFSEEEMEVDPETGLISVPFTSENVSRILASQHEFYASQPWYKYPNRSEAILLSILSVVTLLICTISTYLVIQFLVMTDLNVYDTMNLGILGTFLSWVNQVKQYQPRIFRIVLVVSIKLLQIFIILFFTLDRILRTVVNETQATRNSTNI